MKNHLGAERLNCSRQPVSYVFKYHAAESSSKEVLQEKNNLHLYSKDNHYVFLKLAYFESLLGTQDAFIYF